MAETEVKTTKENKKKADAKKLTIKDKMKKSLFPSAALAIAVSFLLTLYGPLEIYFTNKEDFWFDLYTIIGLDCCMFLIMAAVLFAVLILAGLLHRKVFAVLFTAGTIGYFCLYIEGTFMSRFLPMLDGRNMKWEEYTSHRYISLAVILAVSLIIIILTVIIKYEKSETVLKYLLCGVTLVLLITSVTLAIQNNGFVRKKSMVVNKNHEFEMSSQKNMIIFVIDAIDGDVFNEVLETHPEYYDEFSDFTYYDDMLSCYTQTVYCIPHVLTGDWIDNDADLGKYVSNVYDHSPLFDRLEAENFRIGMYEDEFILAYDCDRILGFENIIRGNVRKPDIHSFVKNQLKLVGYRYFPFDLKRFCIVTDKDFLSAANSNEKENVYYESNMDFYNDLTNATFTLSEQPAFRLYHVEGGHVPFIYNEDMTLTDSGSYELQIAASMTMAKTLIEKLKEAGAYDDSIIIIMADHGFSMEDIPEDRLHPVFFVKGLNEHSGKMRISDAPASHEDMQEAFDRLLDGKPGSEIFDVKDGETRDRRCFVYTYPELLENVEYIQHGKAGDISTLEKVD